MEGELFLFTILVTANVIAETRERRRSTLAFGEQVGGYILAVVVVVGVC